MSDQTPTWVGLTDKDITSILKGISQHPISSIIAPTGSGKTTKLVAALHKKGKSQICVVEPTIPATENPYEYMGNILGREVVGMAAEGDVRYKADTPIVYATSGHIRRKMIGFIKSKRTDLRFCDILMIDEAHSGTLDNDVIMGIWNYAFNKGYAVPKLLIVSATLAIEQTPFADRKDVFVYSIVTKGYPIKIIYNHISYAPESRALLRDTSMRILDTHRNTPISMSTDSTRINPTSLPGNTRLNPTPIKRKPGSPQIYRKVDKSVEVTGDANQLVSEVGFPNVVVENRDVVPTSFSPPINAFIGGEKWLCFCSGVNEVNDMIKNLNTGFTEEELKTVEIVPIYGQISAEERRKVFEPTPIGKRTIIIGTNVAETSVTIDGLSCIFDTMSEKYGETSVSGGFRLVQHRISKSSGQQRAGRTGRQCPGTVYRMITEEDYGFLPEQRPPELTRVPLHSMAIELLDAGINPIELFHGRIDPRKLMLSVGLLKRLGMVTERGSVTEAGTFAATFPLSVRSSGVIWEWIKAKKPLFPCVICMALIDCYGPSYFYYPRVDEPDEQKRTAIIDGHYDKYFSKFEAPTDLGVLLNIWSDVSSFVGKLDPTSKKFHRWCTENSINHRKMRELFNIIRQVCNALYRLNYTVQIGKFNHGTVLDVLTPILQKVYVDLTFEYVGSEKYFDPFNRDFYRLDKRHSLVGTPRPNVEKIITLLSIEIQNKRIGLPVRTITLFHPIGKSVDEQQKSYNSIPTSHTFKSVASLGSKVEITIPRPTSPNYKTNPTGIKNMIIPRPISPLANKNVIIPRPISPSFSLVPTNSTEPNVRLTKPVIVPLGTPLPIKPTPSKPVIVPFGTPLPIGDKNNKSSIIKNKVGSFSIYQNNTVFE
jgi:HrpA-like RNA helicase